MTGTVDYSVLDIPEFHGIIFYPRPDWSAPPPGASDHTIPVGDGIAVAGRHYPSPHPIATILFFHGNGEVASDYDDIAPLYHKLGASLFVADYRGYGRSSGSPGFASMASDAHKALDYAQALVGKSQDSGALFVMGRSLGSHSAIELAWCCAASLRGLILESGFAHVSRLLKYHRPPGAAPKLEAFEKGIEARVKAMKLPVLVVHGEEDTLVPPQHAYRFYENVGSADKTLLTIPGAGHNDIMIVGMREYFAAIEKFVKRLSG